MPTPYRPDLERLRYWQGQTLRSTDARDQQRFDAVRRQLHNRALHETGGVAFGLAATVSGRAPNTIEVACGLAYDARGRDLVLQRARAIPAPAAGPGLQVLRLRHGAAAPACRAPADAGCVAPGAHLLEQDVQLAWGAPASFEPASEVILAVFRDGALDPDFVPRQARPIARPRLATGATVPGDTPWEPWVVERADGRGGILREVVGVQTHVDTSATGFTQRPRYVANLQSQKQAWDLDSAAFAPAFFAHVAEPAADGFTFRLLMTEIARRRYSAWSGTGRVASIERGVGDRLLVEVDPQASFKVGDMLAQLRPRAASVVALDKFSGNKLTLAAALPVKQGDTLAVANLPRMATVQAVPPQDPSMLAAFTATPPVKKGDLLQRSSDGAFALVDGISQGKLNVGKPFAGWTSSDALMVARMGAGAAVKKAALSADGAGLVLELTPAAHGVQPGMSVVLLDGAKLPLSASTPKVFSRSGATIELRPLPPAAAMAGLARVVPLGGGIAIQGLQPQGRPTITLDTIGPFAVGDFVAAASDLSKAARVAQVNKGQRQLELSEPLPVAAQSVIVGLDWQGATTVDVFDPKMPDKVTVGRARAALAGDFVALRADDGFSTAVRVAGVAGKTLLLDQALDGATRLATLAVGRFPRIATVVAQDADPASVTIAEAGAFNPGDCVMRVPAPGAPPGPSAVVQVVGGGAHLVLSDSPGALAPGDRLAPVHWRDMVLVQGVDPLQPARIEVDGAVTFREGDVLGAWVHHADCSNPGYVEKIAGNLLTLLPGLQHGDGIVAQGWIDGGIVGPAAVSLPAPPLPAFPDWQPVVRMEKTLDGLDDRSPATANGLDLLTGQYQSRAVLPLIVDPAGHHLVFFIQATEPYRFRPETLSLITRFNADFPRAFATFAQEQQLVVRWIGCQQEFAAPAGCPAQSPHDACAGAAPATFPEDS